MSHSKPHTETTDDTEALERELADLRKGRDDRAAPDKKATILRSIAKEKLIVEYEGQGLKLGSDFVIVDTGHLADPLLVVTKPSVVQWDKYSSSETTPASRYDYVAPSVKLPSQQEYASFRQRRPGIDTTVSNAMLLMMGLAAEIERGK